MGSKQVYVTTIVDLVDIVPNTWLVMGGDAPLHEMEDPGIKQRVYERMAVS